MVFWIWIATSTQEVNIGTIKSVLGRVCITSFSLVLHHGRFEYKEEGIYHIKSVVGRVHTVVWQLCCDQMTSQ